MIIAHLPPPPRTTANPAPLRPARSIRRTTSIDVSWPDGASGQRLFIGAARDLFTEDASLPPRVINEAQFEARLAEDKTITAISSAFAAGRVEALVGLRAGGHLRMQLREVIPDLIASAHPLYLVLDDLSGSALVSPFAWSQWLPDWEERLLDELGAEQRAALNAQRLNVCWGLQEGNSGMHPDIVPADVASAEAGDVRNPVDPDGWHRLSDHIGPGFRRARRIDVAREEGSGLIRVDSAFQDSVSQPEGGRIAIHEYCLGLTADPETLEIVSIKPEARVLPFSECPGAIHNTQRLVGRRLSDMREDVLTQLRGPEGCTHLNDALRALADVPALAGLLRTFA